MRANHWLDQQEERDPGFLRRIYFSNVPEGELFTADADQRVADILAPIAKAAGVGSITGHVIQKERLRRKLSVASRKPIAHRVTPEMPIAPMPAPLASLPAITVDVEPPPVQQSLPGVEPQSSLEKAVWALYRELKEHHDEMRMLRGSIDELAGAMRATGGKVAA